jgi:hypothetical protein
MVDQIKNGQPEAEWLPLSWHLQDSPHGLAASVSAPGADLSRGVQPTMVWVT